MCEGGAALPAVDLKQRQVANWQALDGRARIILCGLALLVNVAATTAVTPMLLAASALALVARAGVPMPVVARRLAAAWYFAAVAFAVQLFFFGHTTLFQLGPIVATTEGLLQGIFLASRVLGGSSIILALSLTTPAADLLGAAAWLRVPPVLIEIATLIYRYLFLLAEEAERIREAQHARLGYDGWRRALGSYGTMGGMVLLNAYDHAERVYEAMVLRGYSGRFPKQAQPFDRKQILSAGQIAFGIIGAFIVGRML